MLTYQCDRGVPECYHCVRSGWKCDGYPPQVQFHAETFNLPESGSHASSSAHIKSPSPSRSKSGSKLTTNSGQRNLAASRPGLSLPILNTGAQSKEFQAASGPVSINPGYSLQIESLSPALSLYPPLPFGQDVAASKFSSEHLSPTIPMRLQLCFFGSYIRFIPSRIGHNKALDLAVSCLCQAHSMRLQAAPSPEAVVKGNKLYGVALQALQECIHDPLRAFQPELLCAAELLATYEVQPLTPVTIQID